MVICSGQQVRGSTCCLLFTPPATAAGGFKIEVLYPQTPFISWAVASFTQFRLAVKRINETKHHQHASSSGSFPIPEFVARACDSRGESLTALKGAAHLIETDHCNVLIGPHTRPRSQLHRRSRRSTSRNDSAGGLVSCQTALPSAIHPWHRIPGNRLRCCLDR